MDGLKIYLSISTSSTIYSSIHNDWTQSVNGSLLNLFSRYNNLITGSHHHKKDHFGERECQSDAIDNNQSCDLCFFFLSFNRSKDS